MKDHIYVLLRRDKDLPEHPWEAFVLGYRFIAYGSTAAEALSLARKTAQERSTPQRFKEWPAVTELLSREDASALFAILPL